MPFVAGGGPMSQGSAPLIACVQLALVRGLGIHLGALGVGVGHQDEHHPTASMQLFRDFWRLTPTYMQFWGYSCCACRMRSRHVLSYHGIVRVRY